MNKSVTEKEPAQESSTVTLSISELTPDDRNTNKGTQRGQGMLENSLRKHKAGRSILLDRDGNVIAGNKTLEAAASLGAEEVLVIQTYGNQLIAHQRMDIALDSPEGRELALADNRIAEVNLDYDLAQLSALQQEGVEVSGLFNDLEMQEILARLQNDVAFLDQYTTGEPPKSSEILEGGDSGLPETGAPLSQQAVPETVKVLFLLPPGLRDRLVDRLRTIKDEQQLPTLAHALCAALEIPYNDQQ